MYNGHKCDECGFPLNSFVGFCERCGARNDAFMPKPNQYTVIQKPVNGKTIYAVITGTKDNVIKVWCFCDSERNALEIMGLLAKANL